MNSLPNSRKMRSSKPSANLFKATFDKNLPLACTFELTKKCNLECRHCYIDKVAGTSDHELSSSSVKSALRQLKQLGVLFLVFTGGEIFLRKDILELCAYARSLGFDLRLFTNSLLLDEKLVRELSALNLSGVEVSLYGRKTSHEAITGLKGSFEKTLGSIGLLKKHNIRVTIKTPLMDINFKDLPWLIKKAKTLNTTLRIDPTISPTNSGNKDILAHRLTQKQFKAVYEEINEKASHIKRTEQAIDLSCSAGKNFFSISSDGTVYPCLQLMLPLGNLQRSRLKDILAADNKILHNLRCLTIADLESCSKCRLSSFCARCPGLALLEEGDLKAPLRIACRIAKINYSIFHG
jgi:AdoMet-dependent heme synthase